MVVVRLQPARERIHRHSLRGELQEIQRVLIYERSGLRWVVIILLVGREGEGGDRWNHEPNMIPFAERGD